MSDEYTLCPNCRDRYMPPDASKCHACREQEAIDASVPTPIDWSAWDAEYADEEEGGWDGAHERIDCPYCGGDGMEDDSSPCPHCDGEGFKWWM